MSKALAFEFSEAQLQELKEAIKAYFLDELDMEIGDLQTEMFVEFLNQKIGKQYYNLGVTDTIQAVKDKAEDLVLLLKE